MTAYGIEFPAPHGPSPEEITEAYAGQYVTLLMGGEAYLLKVTEAHVMPGGQVVLGCEREVPAEEPVPEPLELADGDCLRMEPGAECPAAGSPRCQGCTWRPAEEVSNG